MHQISRTTIVPVSPEKAFDLIADFSNLPVWDPGSVKSELRLGDGYEPGSTFDVVVTFNGREMPMVYRVVESSRPNRVVLHGKGLTTKAIDTITFDSVPEGTRIGYTADLSLRGPLRLFEKRLGEAFEKLGDAAIAGISRVLTA